MTGAGGPSPVLTPATSRAEAVRCLRAAFAAAALDTPALDARLLVRAALRIDASELVLRPDLPLGEAAATSLCDQARRRIAREPVGRILGEREFWGLPFRLSPETLEPRPDTETVVEAALAQVRRIADVRSPGEPLRLLDLGTGSGCILVALLHELPAASGVGTDRSPGALATAALNAELNGVGRRAAFVACSWADALGGSFDLVVANPPYVADLERSGLQPEVLLYDPEFALFAGPDGLAAYRALLPAAASRLRTGGAVVVEIGVGQAEDVSAIAAAQALRRNDARSDLGGRLRTLAFMGP